MKVLVYINHFFGQNAYFLGKSSLPVGMDADEINRRARLRKQYVTQVIAQARTIKGADVKVCGIEGYSLFDLDVNFENIKERPLWLIYESLNHMAEFVEDYDYFVNLEDDVFLPVETLSKIVEFDKSALLNEILLPNRLEKGPDGAAYCVDLSAIPGWTQQRRVFEGKSFRVALNPHAGLLILSREKLRYALKYIDRNFRQSILHNELDSAFAYFHSPFCLYRSEEIEFHSVFHLDKWSNSPGEADHVGPWRSRMQGITGNDFVPPILAKAYEFLMRRLKGV